MVYSTKYSVTRKSKDASKINAEEADYKVSTGE